MVNEFVCIWFESKQRWVVLIDNGKVIDETFGAIGYAVNSTLTEIGVGESDFDCTEDIGTFYRYERTTEEQNND